MEIQLPESERRWLHAALVLGTVVLALVLVGQVSTILVFFSDLLLVLLLAWLLAFMISPVVSLILRALPGLPRVVVVAVIYLALFAALTTVTLAVAGSLVSSVGNFVAFVNTPGALDARLADLLAPLQSLLSSLGFEFNLIVAVHNLVNSIAGLGDELVAPLADLAVATIGLLANLLIVVFLSLFIVLDKDRLVAYFNRLVPPRWSDEARLFETSVAGSFGGFLRGQAIQGLILAAVAVATHALLGLDFLPASAALVGVLQAIPFFGPILSWAPPVVIAVLTRPDVALPALVAMVAGWFVVNNIVLPRVMASAVGIHPVAVLVSVLVGLKIAGIAGAVFALPVAAVLAAFFHHFIFSASAEPRDVASRAALRVEKREGRRIRVPREPAAAGPLPEPTDGSAVESKSEALETGT
jgi:predicted PurR-regulated permease PerM